MKKKIVELFCEADVIPGGLADDKTLKDVMSHHFPDIKPGSRSYVTSFYLLKDALNKGIEVELEHTDDKDIAEEIAIDHLWEDPDYYEKLKDVEDDE